MPKPGLGVLLGADEDNAPIVDGDVGARLVEGFDFSHVTYSALTFADLPPAEMAARTYAAFHGKPPDAITLQTLLDRLFLGETDLAQMLAAFARMGRPKRLRKLRALQMRYQFAGSLPAQSGLALARLGRSLARLPRNLRRRKSSAGEPVARPASLAKDRPRLAVVATASPSGEIGGAERFYLGLCEALEKAGMAVELVAPPAREDGWRNILESYRQFRALDLSRFDGVISTKAPSYAVRHPNHVCYLVHTMRGWYDMFAASHPFASARTHRYRLQLQAIDSWALRPLKRFAIGEEVAQRLRRFNGLDAQVLHFPSTLAGLKPGPYRHFFLPGRLHPWKRVDLAIAAMRHVGRPIDLVIAGTGQEEHALRALAKGDARIRFTGRIGDAELAANYADALAVLFPTKQEDLGLITLEAFACEKPVLCCADSGEPARMVRDRINGFVCPPEPRKLAERMERLAGEPGLAPGLGKAGAAFVRRIGWSEVAAKLCGALGFKPAEA